MPNVSRCMSTQHPDNVNSPFFAESSELGGEDEIKEAFYSYSHIKCREQLWDCEENEAVSLLNDTKPKSAVQADEKRCIEIIEKLMP